MPARECDGRGSTSPLIPPGGIFVPHATGAAAAPPRTAPGLAGVPDDSDIAQAAGGGQYEEADGGPARNTPLVSILMPVHNAGPFLQEACSSLLAQTHAGAMELLVFDDGPSADDSVAVLRAHAAPFAVRRIHLRIIESPQSGGGPRGCGYGRNALAAVARGEYLCFADADDVMHPRRIECQLALARSHPRLLVGSNFTRIPADATPRFTRWLNALSQEQLYDQQLVETTVATPTWLCHRAAFERAGPFDEGGPGTPDDLMFFYRHLALGGLLAKVELPLVVYRFHGASVTGRRGVPWERIWAVRVAHLEAHLLGRAPTWRAAPFTIWNAGREGRRLFRSLSAEHRSRVAAFCDVDEKKIARGFYHHRESRIEVPIIHWSEAAPPLLLCVKRDLDNDEFLSNLASLNLREGADYIFFS